MVGSPHKTGSDSQMPRIFQFDTAPLGILSGQVGNFGGFPEQKVRGPTQKTSISPGNFANKTVKMDGSPHKAGSDSQMPRIFQFDTAPLGIRSGQVGNFGGFPEQKVRGPTQKTTIFPRKLCELDGQNGWKPT